MTDSTDRVRAAVIRILVRVWSESAYASLSSIHELADPAFSARDRRFASALLYGTISRGPTIDWILQKMLDQPAGRIAPGVMAGLRLGVWQLLWSDRIPPSAAINEAVHLARNAGGEGAARLTNAVLRRIDRERKTLLPANRPHLTAGLSAELYGLLRKWLGDQEAAQFAAVSFHSDFTQTTVRVNRLRAEVSTVRDELTTAGLKAEPGLYCPEALRIHLAGRPIRRLPAYVQGRVTVQDEAAMLVGLICAPRPGEQIVDVCAAPGGKTTHLAEQAGDQADILALDLHPARVALIDEHARRLGLHSIRTSAEDARDARINHAPNADLVLADVPCSGLGLLARKPEIRIHMTYERIMAFPALQLEILQAAASLVRPGGRLVYSTCTINPAENQEVIQRFLDSNPTFSAKDLTDLLPEALLTDSEIAAWARRGMLLLLPHRHSTDGFFVARMQRRLDLDEK